MKPRTVTHGLSTVKPLLPPVSGVSGEESLAAGATVAFLPSIVSGFSTVTSSTYVPGQTMIVAPERAAATAAEMVENPA